MSLVRLAPTYIVRYLPLQPVDCPSLFCKHIKFARGPQPMLSLFSTELQKKILTEGLITSSLRYAVLGLWTYWITFQFFLHVFSQGRLTPKGWGLSAKLGKHSAILGKLGTALQAYTLNPCTKFPPNPTSRKVNT